MTPKILESLKELLLLHNADMEGLEMPTSKQWYDSINKAADAIYEYESSNDIDLEQIRKQQGDLSEICYTC